MILKKLKANGLSWCSCCGKTVEAGQDLVRIEVEQTGSTRYVSLSHLVSWASLSGDGETLPLDRKPPLVPKTEAVPS